MEAQQFAFNVGASRRSLEDEMRRRSLGRQLERIHAENPGALEGMLSGRGPAPAPIRTPSAMRGGGYGGGSNSGPNPGAALQAKWDRQADAISYTPETYEGGGGAGGVLGTSDPRSSGYHRTAADIAIAERRISDADENNAAMRAITAREMQDAYGGSGAYGRGSMAPGQKPGAAFEQALALKMAGKPGAKAPAGTTASGAPKETAKAQMEFLTAQQLYQQATAAEEAAKADRSVTGRWPWSQPTADMDAVEAAAAATAAAKAKLGQAEARYTAAKAVHGEGAPAIAKVAPEQPVPMSVKREGGVPTMAGNTPAMAAAISAKYGAPATPAAAAPVVTATAPKTKDAKAQFAANVEKILGGGPADSTAAGDPGPERPGRPSGVAEIAGAALNLPAISSALKASRKKYAEGAAIANKNASGKKAAGSK